MLDKVRKTLAKGFLDYVDRPVRRLSRTPFKKGAPKRLIVHSGYHKVGTYWFANILQSIAREYGLIFRHCNKGYHPSADFFLDDHSDFGLDRLPPHVGSHILRDPRDVIVSGFYYHKWTRESWAHEPRKDYGGKSYQEYLNALDFHDGLMTEIKRTAVNIEKMAAWDYGNKDFIEIKYEDLIRDEAACFEKIFRHYGFNDAAVDKALKIADQFSFKNVSKRKVGEQKQGTHLRSGKPGEWKTHFGPDHKACFKDLLGDAMVTLGYEKDNDW